MTHLRCQIHNGSKDWIIEMNVHGGLTIRYWTTDIPLRATHIPACACNGGPDNEMRTRIKQKLTKGYVQVGSSGTPDDSVDPEILGVVSGNRNQEGANP